MTLDDLKSSANVTHGAESSAEPQQNLSRTPAEPLQRHADSCREELHRGQTRGLRLLMKFIPVETFRKTQTRVNGPECQKQM